VRPEAKYYCTGPTPLTKKNCGVVKSKRQSAKEAKAEHLMFVMFVLGYTIFERISSQTGLQFLKARYSVFIIMNNCFLVNSEK